jgi:hypothetical protein
MHLRDRRSPSWFYRLCKTDVESGAVSTLGVLFAILVIGLSIGIGVKAMSYQTHMTMEGTNHMQSANTIQMLETRMTRDAASAASVYFPSSCSSNCDDIRFAKRNTDGSWAFWGYAAVPTQQAVAYCTYSLANSTRCSSPIIAPNVLGFRVDQITPALVATTLGLSVTPEAYSKQVYYNTSDAGASLVTTGNNVYIARFATARDTGEAHLIPGVISNAVNEVANVNAASSRGLANGTYGFNFVQGDTVGPPTYSNPSGTTVFDVDRYNGAYTISPLNGGGTAQTWPDDGSSHSLACNYPATGQLAGTLSGSVSNNPTYDTSTGVTAQLMLTATESSYSTGLCYFNVSMTSPNSNDSPTTANMYVDVYGPLTASSNSLSFTNPFSAQQSVEFSEANLVEGNQGGTMEPSAQTCTNIASFSTSAAGGYVANGSDYGFLYVTPVSPGSCSITVAGAWATTKNGTVQVTVGNYSPIQSTSTPAVTLPNSSSSSPTYVVTEANYPNELNFYRSSDNAGPLGIGETCLYNAANQCFVGLVISSISYGGQSKFYLVTNTGSGWYGSTSFYIKDSEGQVYTVNITIPENAITGAFSYTFPNVGAAGPTWSITEGGYSGSFVFVRNFPGVYGWNTGTNSLYDSSSYPIVVAGWSKNGDNIYQLSINGYCEYNTSCTSTSKTGGSATYYLQDSNGQVSPTYTLAVTASGNIVTPGDITVPQSTIANKYSSPYYITESNDWQNLTFSCTGTTMTFKTTTNTVGDYGFEVLETPPLGTSSTCTTTDQHGSTASFTVRIS